MQYFITTLSASAIRPYQEKKKELAYYRPVGPLAYLFMDEDGYPLVGLYEGKLTGELVLMFHIWGRKWLLHAPKNVLNDYMEDKLEFGALLQQSSLTNLANKKTGFPWKTLFNLWSGYFFAGKISKQKRSVPYPNAFYLYQEIKNDRGW